MKEKRITGEEGEEECGIGFGGFRCGFYIGPEAEKGVRGGLNERN